MNPISSPAPFFHVRGSFSHRAATKAVNIGVVALRMAARDEGMYSSDAAIRVKGMALLTVPRSRYCFQRRLRSGRRRRIKA